MNDDNWDLVTGDDAHEIEFLNYSSQINVIQALVRYIIHRHGLGDDGCPRYPNERSLKELHRTGTLFLLDFPGEYRAQPVHVVAGDVVIHDPPAYENVPEHMVETFVALAAMWAMADAVQVGAYVLWRVNWVHPFKNGNGRTARAFCYACVCLKYGFVLPGTTTLIDLIMQNRDDYQNALKRADDSYASTGTPDLGPMNEFVERLLRTQFESIPFED